MKKILALILALVMILAVCAACGGSKAEEPAEAPAAEAAPAAEPAAEPPVAEGEASGEASGAPVAELFPADGYNKDFEGYKQYAIDALKTDEHAPPEIIDATIDSINAAADGDDAAFSMMIYQGRILSYDEFVG